MKCCVPLSALSGERGCAPRVADVWRTYIAASAVRASNALAPLTRQEYTDRLRMKLFPEGPNDPPCPPGMIFVPPDGCRIPPYSDLWRETPPGHRYMPMREAWRTFWETDSGKARLARVAFLQRKTGTIRDDWHLTMAIAHYYGIAPSSFTGPNDAYTLCEKCWQRWENAIALAQHDGTLDTGLQELAWAQLQSCLARLGCPHQRDTRMEFRSDSSGKSISEQLASAASKTWEGVENNIPILGEIIVPILERRVIQALGVSALDGPWPVMDVLGAGLMILSLAEISTQLVAKSNADTSANDVEMPDDIQEILDELEEMDIDEETKKTVRSLAQRLLEHLRKLEAYKKDPDKFDNQGFLKNAPTEEIRERIINGRIRHLEHEINNFRNQIYQAIGEQR